MARLAVERTPILVTLSMFQLRLANSTLPTVRVIMRLVDLDVLPDDGLIAFTTPNSNRDGEMRC